MAHLPIPLGQVYPLQRGKIRMRLLHVDPDHRQIRLALNQPSCGNFTLYVTSRGADNPSIPYETRNL